jgi:alpha-glucosidase
MTEPWWRGMVCYEIYVRSFADAGGDGVGDLAGVRSRLAYLRELGVDAIWLTPFYVSPMLDGGYDIADPRAVDPRFGTLADVDALLADARAHGIRVLIDVVPNHTSAEHRWFRAALAAGPGAPQRRRYWFRPGRGPGGAEPPNDWESAFGGPAWSRVTEPDGRPGEWYLHLHAAAQPDLNWNDPLVRAEYDAVLRFWLDRGVDGVRVDVAHALVKDPALPDTGIRGQHADPRSAGRLPYYDREGVHEIYRRWRTILDSYPGERLAVAEACVFDAGRLARYVRPGGLHQAFNFDYLETPWSAARLRQVIDRSVAATAAVGAAPTWVLSSHDAVRHGSRFGGPEGGLRRGRAATLLMLALPGAAYLYQGEELGLPQVTGLAGDTATDPGGRDGCRVPIPWSGDGPAFGFGPPGSSTSWLPVPAGWAARWAELSVSAQRADPASTLRLYREALRLRRALPAPAGGGLRWLDAPGDTLLFERAPGLVCAVNLGRHAVELPPPGEPLLASGPPPVPDPVTGRVRLPPDTAAWWRRPAPEGSSGGRPAVPP